MQVIPVALPARQLWRFLKADSKVKHFGSLLRESIYDFAGDSVYCRGCTPMPLTPTKKWHAQQYILKHKLPCNTPFCVVETPLLWTNKNTGTWAETHPVLKPFFLRRERIFKTHVHIHNYCKLYCINSMPPWSQYKTFT